MILCLYILFLASIPGSSAQSSLQPVVAELPQCAVRINIFYQVQ